MIVAKNAEKCKMKRRKEDVLRAAHGKKPEKMLPFFGLPEGVFLFLSDFGRKKERQSGEAEKAGGGGNAFSPFSGRRVLGKAAIGYAAFLRFFRSVLRLFSEDILIFFLIYAMNVLLYIIEFGRRPGAG